MPEQLRYARATRLTVIAMIALVALVVFEMIREYAMAMNSPTEWANDTGQPVGILFGAIAAAFGVSFAAVGFPALARHLTERGRYSVPRFAGLLLAGLALPAFAIGALVALMFGSIVQLPLVAAMIFGLCSLFVMPFALLWCWLAR